MTPDAFTLEITKIIQAHPVIAQMPHPDERDDLLLQNVPLPHQKAKAVTL